MSNEFLGARNKAAVGKNSETKTKTTIDDNVDPIPDAKDKLTPKTKEEPHVHVDAQKKDIVV